MKRLVSLMLTVCMLFILTNFATSANGEELRENSWRYKNGELIDIPNEDSEDDVIHLMSSPTMTGIDVSKHQGVIDWDSVKGNIDYAIIRCGYGSDDTSQDDTQWINNVDACTRLGIPFGVYIYSYANTVEKAASEAQHVLRLVKGYNLSFPIYFDMEDTVQGALSTSERGAIATTFCNAIQSAGYEVGIYANKNWWENYLTDSAFNNSSWYKWVAQYNSSCTYSGNYTMWQYTSSGSVPGISGNVDMNYWYGNVRNVGNVSQMSSNSEIQSRISEIGNIMNEKYWNAGKTESELISALNSGNYTYGLTSSACSLSTNDASHHLTEYGCTSNTFNGGRQCAGFAYYMAYAIFGSKPSAANGWTYYSSAEGVTLEPGDIIRYGGHSAMVWYTSGDTLYVIEANWWNNQKRWCQVHLGESWSTVSEVKSNIQYIWKHPSSSIVNPIVPPNAPTNCLVGSWGDRVQIQWDTVSNADIYECGLIDVNTRNVILSAEVNDWYYNFYNVPEGTYFAYVCAKNSAGTSSHSNWPTVEVVYNPPSAPTNCMVGSWGDRVQIQWDTVSNADIYECGLIDVTTRNTILSAEVNDWYYNFYNVPEGIYFAYVCAKNSVGTSSHSNWPTVEVIWDATPTTSPTPTPAPTASPTIPPQNFTVDMQNSYADVTNNGAAQSATVIIAKYNGNALENVTATKMAFSAGQTRTLTLDNGEYKVFVWNSLDGMIPLTK